MTNDVDIANYGDIANDGDIARAMNNQAKQATEFLARMQTDMEPGEFALRQAIVDIITPNTNPVYRAIAFVDADKIVSLVRDWEDT